MEPFARHFANVGFAALIFDYRYLGDSEGEPRGQVIPSEQCDDYRNAITFLMQRPEVDSLRVGVWGTSYAGGHVLHLGAFDRRVRAVVSQVPLVDGWENAQRLMRQDKFRDFLQLLSEDRAHRQDSGQIRYYKVVAPEGEPCVLTTPPSYDWFMKAAKTAPGWRNEVTVESLEGFLEYCPGAAVARISPTPLLMVIADSDVLTPTDLAMRAYTKAGEPKSLCLIRGGHFAVYEEPGFSLAADAAVEWFRTHL
jgi:fermentation-respiration switch protein FrsA (DUF1100 family)